MNEKCENCKVEYIFEYRQKYCSNCGFDLFNNISYQEYPIYENLDNFDVFGKIKPKILEVNSEQNKESIYKSYRLELIITKIVMCILTCCIFTLFISIYFYTLNKIFF